MVTTSLIPSIIGSSDTTAAPTVFDLLNNENAAKVKSTVDTYKSLFQDDKDGKKRKENYMVMVNAFYDLVTDMYEYGWGQSFHFAPRMMGESFNESIVRAEYFLAAKLNLKQGMTVMDVGCGVGGPMRNIHRFSGARVIGINNNAYQIKRATEHNLKAGITEEYASFVQSDFMKLPFPDNYHDAAYEIEATCHAGDKVGCFREIGRTLKPGALFAGYEWCMTSKFNPNDPKHVEAKEGIEKGNSLPEIASIPSVLESLEKAGFEIVEWSDPYQEDAGQFKTVPWWEPLESKWTLSGFKHTQLGRAVTHTMVQWLEYFKAAPVGTTEVSGILNDTAIHLVNAGKMGIFTPDLFFLARKK